MTVVGLAKLVASSFRVFSSAESVKNFLSYIYIYFSLILCEHTFGVIYMLLFIEKSM